MAVGRVQMIFILVVLHVLHSSHCTKWDANEITRMLKTSMQCHANPGMAVAVVKDGEILYSRGFGVTDLDTNQPVSDTTLFGIASITKSFAAALIVKLLYEKTNLTVNSKVRELLEDGFVMSDQVRTRETTFVDLLAHRTALPSYNRLRFNGNITRKNILSLLRYIPTNRQFRGDFVYNNLIYGLISRLSEIIGDGAEWEDLITQHFFVPLGMDNSLFASTEDLMHQRVAVGYEENEGPGIHERVTRELSRRWAAMAGSGAIFSSVLDMVKWMNFHLFQGSNDVGEQIMKPDLVDQLHHPHIVSKTRAYVNIAKPDFPVTSNNRLYALGLRTGFYRGYETMSHTGTTFGYAAYMTLLKTERVGVISLLSGRDKYYRHRAAVQSYLLDYALGLEPWLNSSTICSFPEPWQIPMNVTYRPKPSLEAILRFSVEEYQGQYSHEAFGNIIIHHNTTLQSLVASFGWGTWQLILTQQTGQQQGECFYGNGVGSIHPPDIKSLCFFSRPDAAGTILGIKATFIDEDLPPTFCKKGHTVLCEKQVLSRIDHITTTGSCPGKKGNSADFVHNRIETLCIVMILAIISLRPYGS